MSILSLKLFGKIMINLSIDISSKALSIEKIAENIEISVKTDKNYKLNAQYKFIIMQQGYGRKQRRNMLPFIKTKETIEREKTQKQKKLYEQVQRIDAIIKSDHLTLISGFIFTNQIKNRLADDLLNCIQKDHRLITYGFQIWNEAPQFNFQYLKTNLVPNQPTFKQKLNEVSIKNIEKYQEEKTKQLNKLKDIKWDLIRNKDKTKSTLSQISQSATRKNITATNTPKKLAIVPYINTEKRKLNTQVSIDKQSIQRISIEKIEKMLQKLKQSLISIWLPPKSYPQFYGMLVPLISKSSTSRCRIKKYIFFKQGLSSRFFDSLIEYLSSKQQIQSLQMIVNKSDYLTYFEPIGWKMKSWEGVDRLMIIYN